MHTEILAVAWPLVDQSQEPPSPALNARYFFHSSHVQAGVNIAFDVPARFFWGTGEPRLQELMFLTQGISSARGDPTPRGGGVVFFTPKIWLGKSKPVVVFYLFFLQV